MLSSMLPQTPIDLLSLKSLEPLGLPRFVAVAAGASHSLGLDENNQLWS